MSQEKAILLKTISFIRLQNEDDIPSGMIFLIDPDSALFQRPDILCEYPELDAAGAEAPGARHDDDVPLAGLGWGQGYDLPVRLPLGDQETVAAVDENPGEVLGADAEVLPPDGDLGAGRALPRRDPAHNGGRSHGSGM